MSSTKPATPTSETDTASAEQPVEPSPATSKSKRPANHDYRAGKGRRDEWEAAFLVAFRASGNLRKSAEAAGTTVDTVRRHRNADPAFADKIEDAREEFREHLEWMLVEIGAGRMKGNPLAIMMRLKAELPAKYHEKLQVDGVVKHAHAHVLGSEEAARDLLRLMLSESTDVSRAQLTGGEIIDVPALPPAERQ